MPLDPDIASRLKRTPDGLVCAVVQEHTTRDVLMVAWMNDEALHETLTSGRAVYWSRSRGELWRKGDTSGHAQHVHRVEIDCDGDALLVTVTQDGPACHTGETRCFDAGGDLAAVDSTGAAGSRESSPPVVSAEAAGAVETADAVASVRAVEAADTEERS